ncbi:hypothetical protein MMC25_002786 [Agyrium rufum]|nr:hypothetical protein [Agyrium rufum]
MFEPSQTTTTTTTSKTAITVGGVHYDIDITKIPHLSSFVNFQANAQGQSTELVHEPTLLFDIALKGIESGYRQCFRSLPTDLFQHHTLCDTYHFLHVDILGGQSINEIITDFKSGQSNYNHEERQEIKGDRGFHDGIKDSANVFNAVLYLVSHAATLKWRTRSVVRAAYEERFVFSAKQKAALDRWEKKDPAKLAEEDAGDVTTEEEESDCYYNSDYSD